MKISSLVFNMIKRKNPVIFVIGCTGTGKSDLGVAISKKYGGEVISVDSMQLYKGLDIATNKVTEEETEGIPHHMMSFLDPSTTSKYNVHQFRSDVLKLIDEIRERRKIPVLVGGTTYYAESILYENNIIETSSNADENSSDSETEEDPEISNEEYWAELNRVDPESAEILHANNRHRVWRALQIFKTTGKRKSELVKLQKSDKNAELGGKLRYDDSLVIYLDAKMDVLNERLDSRVDKMIARGLEKELVEFYEEHKNYIDDNKYGVMQCIGLKEFVPWLKMENERGSKNGLKQFVKGCEEVKTHTRQYAKSQRSWYNSRLLKRSDGDRKMASTKMLDTSDKTRIISDGMGIVDEWMSGKELHETVDEEQKAALCGKHLHKYIECDVCQKRIPGTHWKIHISGKPHKHMASVSKKKEVMVESS